MTKPRKLAVLAVPALVACGLSLRDTPSNDAGVPRPVENDAGVVVPVDRDSGMISEDARQDAPSKPDPAKVVQTYAAAAGVVYRLTVAPSGSPRGKFAPLNSAGCPSPAEEMAVFSDGRAYVTSDRNAALYTFTEAAGCRLVRDGGNETYPGALGVAPGGHDLVHGRSTRRVPIRQLRND